MSSPIVLSNFQCPPSPPEAWAGGNWEVSASPRPCACGNTCLQLVEVCPPKDGFPARASIHCPTCGATGLDTAHGSDTAAMRWNYGLMSSPGAV